MQSSQKKYTQCLNDLMDYFILCDTQKLTEYQIEKKLSKNLLHEFTSNESGDQVVELGIILPMRGVENYPYMIYFTKSSESAFAQLESRIQHHKRAYVLEVSNAKIFLLTMPLLRNWPMGTDELLAIRRPFLDIQNGWYEVEVIGGETLQEEGWEPTFEFIFHPSKDKPVMYADIHHSFAMSCKEY